MAAGAAPALGATRRRGLALAIEVVVDQHDQPLDAGITGSLAKPPLETADQAGRSGAPRCEMRVAAASIVSMPSPTTSCAPAGHSLTAPQRPSMRRSSLLRVGRQRNAVDAGRFVARDVAHQREQTGMPGARTERAARVKAQHFIDIGRQAGQVNAAMLGEIARCRRAGDRLAFLPHRYARGSGSAAGRRTRLPVRAAPSSSPVAAAPLPVSVHRPPSANRCGHRVRHSRSSGNGRDRLGRLGVRSSWNGQETLPPTSGAAMRLVEGNIGAFVCFLRCGRRRGARRQSVPLGHARSLVAVHFWPAAWFQPALFVLV